MSPDASVLWLLVTLPAVVGAVLCLTGARGERAAAPVSLATSTVVLALAGVAASTRPAVSAAFVAGDVGRAWASDPLQNVWLGTSIELDRGVAFEPDSAGIAPLAWAYRAMNLLHVRTQPSFIRRELLFEEGDCWDDFLVTESERLLEEARQISVHPTKELREHEKRDLLVVAHVGIGDDRVVGNGRESVVDQVAIRDGGADTGDDAQRGNQNRDPASDRLFAQSPQAASERGVARTVLVHGQVARQTGMVRTRWSGP